MFLSKISFPGDIPDIPNIQSDSCLVRVSDNNDPSKTDVSDVVFSINKTSDVSLTNPNGSQQWIAGSTQPIQYTFSAPVTSVRLFYSIDSGVNWTTIASGQSSGTYPWVIPNINADSVLVKVQDNTNTCIFSLYKVFMLHIPYLDSNDSSVRNDVISITVSLGSYLC